MKELGNDKSRMGTSSVTLFTYQCLSFIPPSALSQLLAQNLSEAHVSPSGARCSVVVITSALHAEGPRFEPEWAHHFPSNTPLHDMSCV